MSQIDKITYLPLLFWFLLFFICFYLLVFTFLISQYIYVFKVRNNFINELIKFVINTYYFIYYLSSFCSVIGWKFSILELSFFQKKTLLDTYKNILVKYSLNVKC